MAERQRVISFDRLRMTDVESVGGKNASLGEMISQLSGAGIRVPGGFATTAAAFREFLDHGGLTTRITQRLSGLDVDDVTALARAGAEIRGWITSAPLPPALDAEIGAAYEAIAGAAPEATWAVRSSATAEDLPDASFAGQQETYLNVQGAGALLETCKRCFASLFTNRAISYRTDKGFAATRIALSIGVQRMVRSDLATSGVMFTLDTETGFRDVVLINAAYGLGENVVQGAVNPDECYLFKPTLAQGFRPILQKITGSKEFKMIYDSGGGRMVRNVPVPPEDRARFCVSDDDLLELARWACVIEEQENGAVAV
jgi:pyruvate,water dikinase